MTKARQNSFVGSCGEPKARTIYALDGTAELHGSDCDTGREYLPMNVFVDPKTMRQQFQGSAIRAWSIGIHAGAVRQARANPVDVFAASAQAVAVCARVLDEPLPVRVAITGVPLAGLCNLG